jgi:hypothetical protein
MLIFAFKLNDMEMTDGISPKLIYRIYQEQEHKSLADIAFLTRLHHTQHNHNLFM